MLAWQEQNFINITEIVMQLLPSNVWRVGSQFFFGMVLDHLLRDTKNFAIVLVLPVTTMPGLPREQESSVTGKQFRGTMLSMATESA